MKDQDSIFFRNFSMLLGLLVLLTMVLAIAGYMMHDDILGDKTMAKDRSAISKTLKSVAKVNTGDPIVAVKAVHEKPQAAFGGSLDGKKIYDNVCTACHTSGVAGAPKLIAGEWTNRVTQGFDGLVKSVMTGKGAMPPKGGRADLSEAQVKSAVKFMTKGFLEVPEDTSDTSQTTQKLDSNLMDKAKAVVTTQVGAVVAKTVDKLPQAVKDVVAKTSDNGKKIYDTVCFVCHATGVANAPKLEKAAWTERMKLGVDALVASAIKGKGAMPPKGGRADLSVADIKASINYMLGNLK